MKDIAATREDWETIAASFHKTRRRPWPSVLEWSFRHLPRGGRVLDLAGGNGRHAIPLAQEGYDVVLADFAAGLLQREEETKGQRGGGPVHPVQASAPALPLREASFDGALFIAALHNIPGRANRLAALAELRRVLKPGAPALVTVWARWQPQYALSFLQELPRAKLTGRRDFGDRIVPWKAEGLNVDRYYHFYSRRELRVDLHAAGFEVTGISGRRITSTLWGDNLFAEARRVD